MVTKMTKVLVQKPMFDENSEYLFLTELLGCCSGSAIVEISIEFMVEM